MPDEVLLRFLRGSSTQLPQQFDDGNVYMPRYRRNVYRCFIRKSVNKSRLREVARLPHLIDEEIDLKSQTFVYEETEIAVDIE